MKGNLIADEIIKVYRVLPVRFIIEGTFEAVVAMLSVDKRVEINRVDISRP